MRQILRLLLIVSSCFTVLAVILLMSTRDQPIARYEPIALEFLPGHVLPHDLVCESTYYSLDYFHLHCRTCHTSQTANLFVTFDERAGHCPHDALRPQQNNR